MTTVASDQVAGQVTVSKSTLYLEELAQCDFSEGHTDSSCLL